MIENKTKNSYNKISLNAPVDNDKLRIMKKFGFLSGLNSMNIKNDPNIIHNQKHNFNHVNSIQSSSYFNNNKYNICVDSSSFLNSGNNLTTCNFYPDSSYFINNNNDNINIFDKQIIKEIIKNEGNLKAIYLSENINKSELKINHQPNINNEKNSNNLIIDNACLEQENALREEKNNKLLNNNSYIGFKTLKIDSMSNIDEINNYDNNIDNKIDNKVDNYNKVDDSNNYNIDNNHFDNNIDNNNIDNNNMSNNINLNNKENHIKNKLNSENKEDVNLKNKSKSRNKDSCLENILTTSYSKDKKNKKLNKSFSKYNNNVKHNIIKDINVLNTNTKNATNNQIYNKFFNGSTSNNANNNVNCFNTKVNVKKKPNKQQSSLMKNIKTIKRNKSKMITPKIKIDNDNGNEYTNNTCDFKKKDEIPIIKTVSGDNYLKVNSNHKAIYTSDIESVKYINNKHCLNANSFSRSANHHIMASVDSCNSPNKCSESKITIPLNNNDCQKLVKNKFNKINNNKNNNKGRDNKNEALILIEMDKEDNDGNNKNSKNDKQKYSKTEKKNNKKKKEINDNNKNEDNNNMIINNLDVNENNNNVNINNINKVIFNESVPDSSNDLDDIKSIGKVVNINELPSKNNEIKMIDNNMCDLKDNDIYIHNNKTNKYNSPKEFENIHLYNHKSNKNVRNNKQDEDNKSLQTEKNDKEDIISMEGSKIPKNSTINSRNSIDQNQKYLKLFDEQCSCNLSPRLIIDEGTSVNKQIIPNHEFKFINEIKQENDKFPLINCRSFLKLNDYSLFVLMSFCYESYNLLVDTNNYLAAKINYSLSKIFSNPIDQFKEKYKNFLEIKGYKFKQKKFILNRRTTYTLNLVIECQIITKETKKSFEIGCNYTTNDNKKLDNIWKFDVQKKNNYKIWLSSEFIIVNNIYKRFTYSSQISCFSYKDKFELQLNVFNKENYINPFSIEWQCPIITDVDPNLYENTRYISSVNFDPLRSCEIETQILIWKCYNDYIDDYTNINKNIINEFKKIFEKNFKIFDIGYDISKYIFYKIKMKAIKTGVIKINKFVSFELVIVDENLSIKNEIECIFLVNGNYYTNKMEIRLGTYINFYIVDKN